MISRQKSISKGEPALIAPGPLEYASRQQHRHIAAHAIALRGDVLQCGNCFLAHSCRKRVELDDIPPGWEVWVTPPGEDVPG